MEFYQPYSILFSHSDDPDYELRHHTRVYLPANHNIQVYVTPGSGSTNTTVDIKAILSDTESQARIHEIPLVLDWDGANHLVVTEVKDLADVSKGKNALHTSGATQY